MSNYRLWIKYTRSLHQINFFAAKHTFLIRHTAQIVCALFGINKQPFSHDFWSVIFLTHTNKLSYKDSHAQATEWYTLQAIFTQSFWMCYVKKIIYMQLNRLHSWPELQVNATWRYVVGWGLNWDKVIESQGASRRFTSNGEKINGVISHLRTTKANSWKSLTYISGMLVCGYAGMRYTGKGYRSRTRTTGKVQRKHIFATAFWPLKHLHI